MASEFIVFERCLFESKAFRPLGGVAKTVLFDFRLKCTLTRIKTPAGRQKEWVITNNGQIEYCYSEAEGRGISRKQFVKAIDQLLEYGFIKIAHQGQGGHKGDKSKYAMSERWRTWGTPDFEKIERPKDTRDGRGWSAYHQKKKEKAAKISSLKIVKERPRRRKTIVTEQGKRAAASENYEDY